MNNVMSTYTRSCAFSGVVVLTKEFADSCCRIKNNFNVCQNMYSCKVLNCSVIKVLPVMSPIYKENYENRYLAHCIVHRIICYNYKSVRPHKSVQS